MDCPIEPSLTALLPRSVGTWTFIIMRICMAPSHFGAMSICPKATTGSTGLCEKRVNPALCLGAAGPAAGALVVASGHGLGAGPAADRLVALIEELVVGDVVLEDVRPGLVARPARQRVHLDER